MIKKNIDRLSFLCDYMEAKERLIQIYQSQNGKAPFEDWIQDLRDAKTKARILQRIDRIRLGNFGDCQSVGQGVYELRISWGPGFRIYYGLLGSGIVLLLCGGDKSSQKKDVSKAHQLWKEFKET